MSPRRCIFWRGESNNRFTAMHLDFNAVGGFRSLMVIW